MREYEGLVLDWLRRHLAEELLRLRIGGWGLRVEDVRLETSGHERMLAILLRDEARPECLFGWRFPSNDRSETDPEARRSWGPEQAEVWANAIVLTNLEEEIMAVGYGLPSECAPEGVTWFGDYLPQ